MKVRIPLKWFGLLVALGLVSLSQGVAWAQQNIPPGIPPGVLAFADMIVYNGKVVTMDDHSKEPRMGTVVQAMAIRDGKILALGTNESVLPYGGEKTRKIDLKGLTVIPGLINPHLHLHEQTRGKWGLPVKPPVVIRSDDPEVVQKELRSAIAEHIAKEKPGTWLEISITDRKHSRLALNGPLQRPLLDQLAPNHPVWLNMGGSVLNGTAMKSLEDFWGGPMVDDSIDKKAGIMKFYTEITRSVPYDIWMKGQIPYLKGILIKSMEEQASFGLTAYASHIMAPNWINTYGDLDRHHQMPIRFAWVSRSGTLFNQAASDFYRRLGDLSGVGSDFLWNVGSNVGHLDDTGFQWSCYSMPAPPEVKAQEGCVAEEGSFKRGVMLTMVSSGQRIYGTHVFGDRGLDQYLDIIEEGSRKMGLNLEQIRAKRHGVDHGGAVRPDQMVRLANLNMFQSYTGGVEQQSLFLVKNYGEQYVSLAYPVHSSLKAGVTPVWEGGGFTRLQDFIQRKGKDGRVWAPEERIDRTTALKMATVWPAEYIMREDTLGSLETGKWGDFVVLNKDYWDVPEDEIKTVDALMTVVGGKIAFLDQAYAPKIGLQPAGFQKIGK